MLVTANKSQILQHDLQSDCMTLLERRCCLFKCNVSPTGCGITVHVGVAVHVGMFVNVGIPVSVSVAV